MRLVYLTLGWAAGIVLAANVPLHLPLIWLALALITAILTWRSRRIEGFVALLFMLGGLRMAIAQTPGVEPATVQMQPPETATTVRVQDGKVLTTDGPFVEMKEALGGYLFYEADDLDAAIELASRIPAARLGGGIEIRPLKGAYGSSTRSSARSGAASSPP